MLRETAVLATSGVTPLKVLQCNIVKNLIKGTIIISSEGINGTLAAKKKGMTDKMLKELISVVGMANETNRLVESYQVEIDKFLK